MSQQPPPEEGIPLRKLGTKLAREVSELLLLELDLTRCVQGLRLWGSIQTGDDPMQAHASSALFRDSVIGFTACFDGAAPLNLEAEAVYGHLDGGTTYFRWLKDMRDTWIAHRIGPQRYAAYGYLIHPDTGDIVGEGRLVGVYHEPERTAAGELAAFAQIAVDYTSRLLAERLPELRREVEALYPNQRLRLPSARFTAPGPDSLRVGRRKYENAAAQRARAPRAPDGGPK